MFNRRTVFVVGAGASAEFCLPVGDALKREIARKLSFQSDGFNVTGGDQEIWTAIRNEFARANSANERLNPYFQACRQIAGLMDQAPSIDYFIDAHKEDKEIIACGKLAISKSILDAERRSLLCADYERNMPDSEMVFSKISDTWIAELQRIAFAGASRSAPEKCFENISFITFNYDRCIEHFLYHAARRYFHLDNSVAAILVSEVPVVHVYGRVGRLSWQSGSQLAVPFGVYPGSARIFEIADQLKTFTEGRDDPDQQKEIENVVSGAENIVFLGCGFHPQNIDAISVKNRESKSIATKNIYGTAWGISESDISVISAYLRETFLGRINLINLKSSLKSSGIFSEFRRSLSM